MALNKIMESVLQFLKSSLGRKYLMAVSGLSLVGFLVVHLLGNILLYDASGEAFNAYVFGLYSLGPLLPVAEIALAALFLFHIALAFILKKDHHEARPQKYHKQESKGAKQSSVASRNMIISGVILLLFLILHIWQFRFGPGIDQGYVTQVNGEESRDLFRLVVEVFSNPIYVLIYCFAIAFVGFHLRHGFWSAFQSLGLSNPKLSNLIFSVALLIALLLCIGFFTIPLWIFFDPLGLYS